MAKISRYDFIPAQDEKFLVWSKLLISTLTSALGVEDGATQDFSARTTEFADLVDKATTAQNTAKQASSMKRTARQGLEKDLRIEIRRIKTRADYTVSLGMRMGIEAPSKSGDMTGMAPKIEATDRTGGIIEINFSKYGSDGVNIYGKRDGETDWSLLAHASRAPFEDHRPLLNIGCAELRRYSAVYVKRRQEVGQFSDEVVIACAP